ncbi:MAG TPA: hypothetical protein VMF89_02885 [Polyangiales bacterium]|nr:hypothetical protein [Polyangiales bacterium]
MAGYNLGNYGSQLSIDDYDKALANSGYTQQQSGGVGAGNPFTQSLQQTRPQATESEKAPGWAADNGQKSGGAQSQGDLSGSSTVPYGSNKKDDGQSKLGNILGIVGKIAAFL